MKTVFVDTLYWIAFTNPKDQWHEAAATVEGELGRVKVVTTELVVIELLNYFCSFSAEMRDIAAQVAREILSDPETDVLPHTSEDLIEGLRLYEARPDKGYSLTDCVSMNLMRTRGITEVFTHDKHFAQEGFTILM